MLEKIIIVEKPESISWQQITDLLHNAYRVHLNNYLHFAATNQSAKRTEQRVKNGTCLVALAGGQLVGTISFERHFNTSSTSWYIEDDYVSFYMFGVLEEFKGLGIGSMLLEAVEQYAKTQNSKAIITDTALPAKKLVQFYRNHGYKPVGATAWETTNYVSVLLKKEINCEVVPEEICLQRFEEEKKKYSARQNRFEMELRSMELAKNPIAIVIANLIQFYSILPAMKELDRHGVGYDIFVPRYDSPELQAEGWNSMERDMMDYLLLNGYKPMQTAHSCHYTICLSAYPNLVSIKADINIRYRYGYVTKPEFSYSVEHGVFYDYILCYNKEDASVLSAYAKTLIVGELKLADYRPTQLKSSGAKKTLLYLPTYGEASSIPAVCKELGNLANQYDIIVKAHHGTSFLTAEQSAMREVEQVFHEIYDSRTSLYDLLAKVDLVLSDNSGAIYDAIAMEVPVAIFNQYPPIYFEDALSPQYQLVQDGVIPATGDTVQLAAILEKALLPEYIEKQKKVKSQIFAVDGEHCLSVFWNFIQMLLEKGAEKGYQLAHRRLYREYLAFSTKVQDMEQELSKTTADNLVFASKVQELERELSKEAAQHLEVMRQLSEKKSHIVDMNKQMEYMRAHIYNLQMEKKAKEESFSWRITKPLRVIHGLCNMKTIKTKLKCCISKAYRKLRLSAFGQWIKRFVPRSIKAKLGEKFLVSSATATPQYGKLKNDIADFSARLRAGNSKVLMIISGVEYVDNEGQRCIRLAHQAMLHGWKVVFCYWRWNVSDDIPPIAENMLQIPIDYLWKNRNGLFSDAFNMPNKKAMLIEFPHPKVMGLVSLANCYSWVTLYDVIDDWEEFHKNGQAVWYSQKVEQKIVSMVDINIATAQRLKNKLSGYCSIDAPYHVIPNGVDPNRMSPCIRLPEYDFTKGNLQIGYFGHLTDAWFDWSMLRDIAKKRSDWTFHLIGYGEPEGLRLPENIILYGKKAPEELPKYAAYWDVAIIPFINCELTLGVNPIKIYEYLQLGLPTVASNMPEISGFPYTQLAVGATAFESAIEEAAVLRMDTQSIEEFIHQNTWEMRFLSLAKSIEEFTPELTYKVIFSNKEF